MWKHTISKISCYNLASEDGILLNNWDEYLGLNDVIHFLIWGRSYGFQHKEGAYAYDKNTDGVTLFLKATTLIKSPSSPPHETSI